MSKKSFPPLPPVEIVLKSPEPRKTNPTCLPHNRPTLARFRQFSCYLKFFGPVLTALLILIRRSEQAQTRFTVNQALYNKNNRLSPTK